MSRFAAIVAQLKDQDLWIEQDKRKLRDSIRALKDALEEIADGVEHKGSSWVCERAKRALIEAQEIET